MALRIHGRRGTVQRFTERIKTMGWTGEYLYGKLSYAEEKARVVAKYTFTLESGVSARPVQVSNARPNWYLAVEVTVPAGVDHDTYPYVAETLADGSRRYVFAEVLLTRHSAREWMYKEVCEGAGPYAADAPKSLIAKLSPLQDGPLEQEQTYGTFPTRIGSAKRWRESVLARYNQPRLKEGDKIRTKHPLNFEAGECQNFTVTTYYWNGKNKRCYYADDLAGRPRVRFTKAALAAGFEVLS